MSYCNIHGTNNCIECALAKQTKEIVAAIEKAAQQHLCQQVDREPPRKMSAMEWFFRRDTK